MTTTTTATDHGTMTGTMTGTIDHFELRYHLHPGLSDADRSKNWTERYPATRAGLALALDRRDYQCLHLCGWYGNARADVYAITDNGEVRIGTDAPDDVYAEETDISEDCAYDLLTSDGELDATAAHAVHAMRGPVWDGQNHVEFTPERSLRLLAALGYGD